MMKNTKVTKNQTKYAYDSTVVAANESMISVCAKKKSGTPKTRRLIFRSKNTKLQSKVKELEILVKFYEEQFRLLKSKQFASSSEKSAYDTGQIRLSDLMEPKEGSCGEKDDCRDGGRENGQGGIYHPGYGLGFVKAHNRKRRRLKDSMPEDLPVEEVICELTESEQVCPKCSGNLHTMGKDGRDELVIIPAKVMIRRCRCYV